MNEFDVAKKLHYNMYYYKKYKEYSFDYDTEYLTFEQFLLISDNFDVYMENPDQIKREYFSYHEYQNPQDFESFEVFCDSFKLFPYDSSLIDDQRKCENCRFYNYHESTIGYDNFCNSDIFLTYEDPCCNHMFDIEKGKKLVRSLYKDNINKKIR